MAAKVKPTSVKDVNQHDFVGALAAFLKKSGKVKVPEWSDLVKTAVYKEYAPFNEDWFYVRCASIARHAYIRSPLGVGQIRRMYGGHKNNGVRPSHFCKSSGNIARKALQALESVKILEKDPNTGGRKLTPRDRGIWIELPAN